VGLVVGRDGDASGARSCVPPSARCTGSQRSNPARPDARRASAILRSWRPTLMLCPPAAVVHCSSNGQSPQTGPNWATPDPSLRDGSPSSVWPARSRCRCRGRSRRHPWRNVQGEGRLDHDVSASLQTDQSLHGMQSVWATQHRQSVSPAPTIASSHSYQCVPPGSFGGCRLTTAVTCVSGRPLSKGWWTRAIDPYPTRPTYAGKVGAIIAFPQFGS
jgi:hypothetical protein